MRGKRTQSWIWFLFFLIFSPLVDLKGDELSFIIPLPKPHAVHAHSQLKNMSRDTMTYMISTFIDPTQGSLRIIETSDPEQTDWGIVISASVLPLARESYRLASSTNSPLQAFQILRDLISSDVFFDSRKLFHTQFPVFESVKDLHNHYHFEEWKSELIETSSVKGLNRIIYRSPQNIHPISISQTIKPNGDIRETELIIGREDLSRQFDFFAYDQKGTLRKTSVFHSKNGKEVEASVPYTCLTCHYDGNDRIFQTSPTSYSGSRFQDWLILQKLQFDAESFRQAIQSH